MPSPRRQLAGSCAPSLGRGERGDSSHSWLSHLRHTQAVPSAVLPFRAVSGTSRSRRDPRDLRKPQVQVSASWCRVVFSVDPQFGHVCGSTLLFGFDGNAEFLGSVGDPSDEPSERSEVVQLGVRPNRPVPSEDVGEIADIYRRNAFVVQPFDNVASDRVHFVVAPSRPASIQ